MRKSERDTIQGRKTNDLYLEEMPLHVSYLTTEDTMIVL